ncbi:MAG TPA: RIP metalloprotease RseP [Anseongella sp.]
MNGLMMAAQMLAALSILIILHELGHFLAARAFGIKVEKFYLFFDAWGLKLFKFRKGDCEYGIGWLPLGGYVKISGMIDESMDTEQLKQPAQPWEFRSKPAWQRLIVMLAGVFVNVILGIAVFWMLTLKYGETYLPASEVKYGIVAHDAAQGIGLETGDKIIAVNGEPLENFDDLLSPDVLLGNTALTVQRGTEELEIVIPPDFLNTLAEQGRESFISPRFMFTVGAVTPESNAEKAGLQQEDQILAVDEEQVTFFDQFQAALAARESKQVELTVLRASDTTRLSAMTDAEGKLGFQVIPQGLEPKTIHYGFMEALPKSVSRSFETLALQVRSFGKLFKGELDPQKTLSGPIGIAQQFGGEFDGLNFWTLVGLLSLVLAFMNILPIPALDGGHALFLLVEMVKGEPLSDKFLEKAQIVGFVILLALMVFVFGNDILNIVKN